ncbi:calcium-binding protein, partial [bacterium]|nr:calcium-binding protein [bacterium]
ENYEYQIIRPSNISETDNLISVVLEPRDDYSGDWLTVTNQGVLQGTADFGNEHRSQRYKLTLNYESGSSVETNFNVFTNSYVETNEWGHDYNYNLNYYYNPSQVYANQNLSVNISNPDYVKLEFRMDNAYQNYESFKILDQSGADISNSLDFSEASNNIFKIVHSFMDGNTSGEEVIAVSGYTWVYKEGGLVLEVQIEPNLYNGQSTLGPEDIIQVVLAPGVQIEFEDGTRDTLSNIIPSEHVFQEGVAFENKDSIEISTRWDGMAIDTSVEINPFGYSGVYVNAGPSDVTHDGFVIPAYSSIAPDGTILDIFAIAAEEHGLEIHTSPLDDVLYLSAENGDHPVVRWSPGNDYIVMSSDNDWPSFSASPYHDSYIGKEFAEYGLPSEGLTFNFNAGVLTVETDYGVTTVENVRNVYGTRGDDIFIGDENYQNFRGDGGYDTFTGGVGEDHFRLESHTRWDYDTQSQVYLDSFARITDFENADRVSLEDYGFSLDHDIAAGQFSVRQDLAKNETYISVHTDEYTIDDIFTIDGIFFRHNFYTEVEDESGDINLRIRLSDNEYIATDGNDTLGPIGDYYRQDVILSGLDQNYNLNGGLGFDIIGGGSENDILDGGQELYLDEYGFSVDANGYLEKDQLTYIDAPSGINANLITGIVQDGYGSTDQVSNFERLYGSFYNDTVVLSSDLTRGYVPGYGNDTIIAFDSLDPAGPYRSYIGYWNLDVDDGVTDTSINVNWDDGVVTKTITGGAFEGVYQDTITGYLDTIIGSRSDDVFYGLSSGAYFDTMSVSYHDSSTYSVDSGYGLLHGYHGDDTLIALGTGEDRLIGSRDNDLLVVYGHGEFNKISGDFQPGAVASLTYIDTFVIGGQGKVQITDYQIGEEIILLDYSIQSADQITIDYDFGLDQTFLSIATSTENQSDKIIINGRLEIDTAEATTFSNQYTQGSIIDNDTTDYKITLKSFYNDIYGSDNDDDINGTSSPDRIYINGGNKSVFGLGGDDILIHNASGDQEYDGGEGIDTLEIHYQNWTSAPEDYLGEINLSTSFVGSPADRDNPLNDTVTNIENATVFGDFDFIIVGDSNNNVLKGGFGDDILYTGDGDDKIFGNFGDDTLILNGSGSSVLDGGEGVDTFGIDLTNWTAPVDDPNFIFLADLTTEFAGSKNDPSHINNDKIINIENIDFKGPIDAELIGDDGDNVISSDLGDDIIRGGDGDDTLSSGAGTDIVYGDAGNDTIIQNGSGDQTYYGGEGIDTFELRIVGDLAETFVAEIDLVNGWVGPLDDPEHALSDKIYEIENVVFNDNYDIVITGDSNDNVIASGAGDDVIRGGDGDDTLSSGAGTDIVYGDAGNDTIILNGSGAQSFYGGEGIDTLEFHLQNFNFDKDFVGEINLLERWSGPLDDTEHALNDKIYEIENVILISNSSYKIIGDGNNNILKGGSGNDIIKGGKGDDTLSSGSGDDQLFGGLGEDTLIISGTGDTVLDGGEGIDTFGIDLTNWTSPSDDPSFTYKTDLSTGFTGSKNNPDAVNNDDLINIENIDYTGSYDAELIGDANNNIIKSDAGNDVLHGGDGNDVLKSGGGDDFIYGDKGNDVLILNGSGVQTFDGGEGIDTFKHDFSAGTLNPDFEQVIDIDLVNGTTGQKGNTAFRDQLANIENITYRGYINAEMTGDDNDN